MLRSAHKFLLSTVVTALLGVTPFSLVYAAQDQINIRIGSIINKDHVLSQAVYRLADAVDKRSAGRIKMSYYPLSQLGNAVEQISGTRAGTQEIWFGAIGQMARVMSDFQLFSPAFAYDNREAELAVLNSPFFAAMRDKLRDKAGLIVLNWDWFRGYRSVCSIRPIRTLEDLKGLKLRVPPSPAKLSSWKALGASPTPTAAAEIFLAMKEKVIEGVEINLQTIHGDHFDEVCKYVTMTQHDPVLTSFVVNAKFWNSLPGADQKIILDALKEAGEWSNSNFAKVEAATVETMKKEMGVEFITLSKNEYKRWLDIGQQNFLELEKTKKWWPAGTVEKIRAKDPSVYKP